MSLPTGEGPPLKFPPVDFASYYLAVAEEHQKLPTMADFCAALFAESCQPTVIVVDSRDALDDVLIALRPVADAARMDMICLHSDQPPVERSAALAAFAAAAAAHAADGRGALAASTDAALPTAGAGESPLPARFLLHASLPPKQAYFRRAAAVLGGGGRRTAVAIVAAADAAAVHGLESAAGVKMRVLPLGVADLL